MTIAIAKAYYVRMLWCMNRDPSDRTLDARDLDEEDRRDLDDARAALREFHDLGEPAVPWEEVKRRLDLP